MKKFLMALAVLLAVQVADAQTVKTPSAAKSALDKAVAASQDAKKATKVATWLKVATAYMDAYNAPAGAVWVGASKQDLQLIMPDLKPTETAQAVLGGDACVKETYPNFDLYFNQAGQVIMIYVTKPVVEDALAGALEAYKKAYEVDVKQSKLKDITAGIEKITKKYYDDGMNEYMLDNLAAAGDLLAKAADASYVEPYAKPDTTSLYNAGFISWMVKDYEKAKKYFQACLDINYYFEDGEVFARLADVYVNLGDNDAARETLEAGFTKFPQSQAILIGLINYYMSNSNNPNRLFELINLAKKNEPNNASLYYVEGNVYVELRKADPDNGDTYVAKAAEAYDACAGINPDYEFGYIGKGIMYYNIAIELQEKAAAELDDAKWVKLNKQFSEALKNALEPFEKAYNVSKDDSLRVNVAEYLKNIYYRFSSDGPEWEEGYRKYDEVVKTGKPL
jgi:tetratricopeptide (TPR) repeat protein